MKPVMYLLMEGHIEVIYTSLVINSKEYCARLMIVF